MAVILRVKHAEIPRGRLDTAVTKNTIVRASLSAALGLEIVAATGADDRLAVL